MFNLHLPGAPAFIRVLFMTSREWVPVILQGQRIDRIFKIFFLFLNILKSFLPIPPGGGGSTSRPKAPVSSVERGDDISRPLRQVSDLIFVLFFSVLEEVGKHLKVFFHQSFDAFRHFLSSLKIVGLAKLESDGGKRFPVANEIKNKS
jgi:hypothetical protein